MRRTKEEAELTKTLIISNAVALFLKKGFSSTTLDQIALATGVTRGAIYWHFEDKLDIINHLIEKEIGELYQLMDQAFSIEIPILDKIEHILKTVVHNYYCNQSFCDFVELTWFKMEYTQLSNLRKSKAEPTQYFIDKFEKLILQAQREKQIVQDTNAFDVAITVTHMINGMYRMRYLLPDEMNTEQKAMRPFTNYLKLLTDLPKNTRSN